MSEVVQFPQAPKCTNIWATCTHDDCPLKALCAIYGPTTYLGNCGRYLMHWFAQQQKGDSSE